VKQNKCPSEECRMAGGGADNCNVCVSCGRWRDRSISALTAGKPARKRFAKKRRRIHLLPSHFLQKHPTSLSTSLHHLTLTALPVWPNRVTIEASSRRRPFLELKRPVQLLPNPVSPHYQHKARARLCSKSSGAILSIDHQSTRNTRARQPSTRATTP
jgi:hypothetical protein